VKRALQVTRRVVLGRNRRGPPFVRRLPRRRIGRRVDRIETAPARMTVELQVNGQPYALKLDRAPPCSTHYANISR